MGGQCGGWDVRQDFYLNIVTFLTPSYTCFTHFSAHNSAPVAGVSPGCPKMELIGWL